MLQIHKVMEKTSVSDDSAGSPTGPPLGEPAASRVRQRKRCQPKAPSKPESRCTLRGTPSMFYAAQVFGAATSNTLYAFRAPDGCSGASRHATRPTAVALAADRQKQYIVISVRRQ